MQIAIAASVVHHCETTKKKKQKTRPAPLAQRSSATVDGKVVKGDWAAQRLEYSGIEMQFSDCGPVR